MDKLEEGVIRAYGTPRFLINKTPENRATAYVEFEAYVEGVIKPNQRYFKRVLESEMWYDRLARLAMEETWVRKLLKAVALPGQELSKISSQLKPLTSMPWRQRLQVFMVTVAAVLAEFLRDCF